MLELINVSKYYEILENNQPNYVLKEITINISKGESIAIIGPSGSGKSTLLNIIGALDRPSEGKVVLDGKDLSLMDDKQLAFVRNQEIGFIFQLHHLLPQCTVLENVLIPTLAFKNSKKSDAVDYAYNLLERVGLKDKFFHRPGQLSGGERQRVAVVRALINHPKLLLADEPTGSLDHSNALSLAQLLVEINQRESVTLIMVTHSLELASKMSIILELKEGKLIGK
ncbi:MAG: ABC transporter ATP-binding protein [Candidatus Poribacteria bacterium]